MPVNDAERDGPQRVAAHLEEQRQAREARRLQEELREHARWEYRFAERVLVLLTEIRDRLPKEPA